MKNEKNQVGTLSLILVITVLLSSCKCEDLPDLKFATDALAVLVGPYSPEAGQAINIVSPILNDYLVVKNRCEDELKTPLAYRSMAFSFRANPGDPWNEINVINGKSATGLANIELELKSLRNGEEVIYQDDFVAQTNGEYRVEFLLDSKNQIEERDKDNNSSAKETSSVSNKKQLIFEVKGLPENNKNELPTIFYAGTKEISYHQYFSFINKRSR